MAEQNGIRPVNESDAGFLYVLMNDPAVLRALNEVPTSERDWADAIGEWSRDEDEEDYIILENGAPAGWLGVNGLRGGDGTAYLKMAAVLPEYQGQGTGTRAVRELLAGLKRRGYERIILYTDKENRAAQACYGKCGFRFAGSLTETMPNGKTVPRYRMECRL